jgi:threonine dehydrogenase-like Zn-dependent dehydrogenase
MSRDGALAELLALPEERLISIPEEVPDASAALCEPFATAARAALDKCRTGCRVAVLGPGTLGLMVAMLGLLSQPELLVVAGTEEDEDRLELAQTLGASTVALSPGSETEALFDALGGPANLVFEASGAAVAVKAGLEVLEPEGALVVIGMHSQAVPMDLGTLVRGERRVEGSYAAGIRDWKQALNLLRERLVNLDPLVGPTFALDEAKAAFRATERGVVGRALVRCAP